MYKQNKRPAKLPTGFITPPALSANEEIMTKITPAISEGKSQRGMLLRASVNTRTIIIKNPVATID
jgi:hypothetical protein